MKRDVGGIEMEDTLAREWNERDMKEKGREIKWTRITTWTGGGTKGGWKGT